MPVRPARALSERFADFVDELFEVAIGRFEELSSAELDSYRLL